MGSKPMGVWYRVVYRFDTGSFFDIDIDIPYTGTGRSVFWLVFPGVSKMLAALLPILPAPRKKFVCHKGGGRVCFSEGGGHAASE